MLVYFEDLIRDTSDGFVVFISDEAFAPGWDGSFIIPALDDGDNGLVEWARALATFVMPTTCASPQNILEGRYYLTENCNGLYVVYPTGNSEQECYILPSSASIEYKNPSGPM